MSNTLLPAWKNIRWPVIGVLHVPPLPGSPRFAGNIAAVTDFVRRDAETLVAGGVHGLLLENFGDAPFTRGRVPAAVVAHMTRLAHEIRQLCPLPLGINVLRNDGRSALAVAAAVGGQFIRVNVLCGARLTDQGVIEGDAYHLLRDRQMLGAGELKILADIDVKHSSPLGPVRPLEELTAETIERGGADAVIATGGATGQPADLQELTRMRAAAGDRPVFVGSGVRADTVSAYESLADGFIVGTAFKRDGLLTNPVDLARVKDLIERLR